jgi:hypothetical protein
MLISICDQILARVDSVLKDSDTYFSQHVEFNPFYVDLDDEPPRREHRIVVMGDTGRELEQRLLRQFDAIAKLSGAAGCSAAVVPHALCHWLVEEGRQWLGPFENHHRRISDHMAAIKDAIAALPDSSAGETLLVADTNALLRFPAIDKWKFSDIDRFTIVLPSAVLSEIDSFETSNKSVEIKQISKKLVTQIKGYRDRCRDAGGNIQIGAVIVRDRISLRLDPLEPSFDGTLSFLNPDANDHKILARTIGLMREHPKSKVALITRDINLQNKAELANVPTVEPPDPPAIESK